MRNPTRTPIICIGCRIPFRATRAADITNVEGIKYGGIQSKMRDIYSNGREFANMMAMYYIAKEEETVGTQ